MLYRITNGTIEAGGKPILKNITFEIREGSKTAVVGRNGAGKTTLLRAVNGELEVLGENHDVACVSAKPDIRIGYLKQITFEDDTVTLEAEVKRAFSRFTDIKARMDLLLERLESGGTPEIAQEYAETESYFKLIGGYYYEKEYDTVVSSFGFTDADRHKRLCEFSGGQRTKIAFARLLLSKPDILLLDEPTNHLDMDSTIWLEGYLRGYPGAVLLVSHDRMFLDRIADTVYEAQYGTLTKYHGNYTAFAQQKKERYEKQKREYEAQQKEIARLTQLVEKFRYKPTKASMAASKLKAIEHMTPVPPPERFDLKQFYTDLTPQVESAGTVLTALDLEIGYDRVLAEVSLEIKRGRKIGIIGGNGIGKSTFLKTLTGEIKPISGSFRFGAGVSIGYFDQQMAQYSSEKTVLEDYSDAFKLLSSTGARNELGAFLFRGDDVFKKISVLSGGERVRLALCKIFRKRPNFLLLDEPTNHMDIVGVQALEAMLEDYSGTLLCVSHDRYFINKIADSLLIFEADGVTFFPYGYDAWQERQTAVRTVSVSEPPGSDRTQNTPAKQRYTTPLKELDRIKKRIAKIDALLTEKQDRIDAWNAEIQNGDTASDYERLCELTDNIAAAEEEMLSLMEEHEQLTSRLETQQSIC